MEVILCITAGPHRGREFVFGRPGTFPVGRQCQIGLPEDRELSRNHFLLEINPPFCHLMDMRSTNGTLVNGLRVEKVRLGDGDVITAGKTTFVLRIDETSTEARQIRCRSCGLPAPAEAAASLPPARGANPPEWYCSPCRILRQSFPPPPPGFWIERRIGGGGMGMVFLARREGDNRRVAIKMINPKAAGARTRDYFRREMEVLKSLRHENIIAFYDMLEVDGQFHLIMEYIDGQSAHEWLAALPGPLPVPAAARIGVQLLKALDHAHSRGFVHRDIKPSNLLVMGPPQRPLVKLSDFGLAKNFRDDSGKSGLTHDGDIGGSVGFLSPDHIRDFREAKEPADIYSAGATLYYLLTRHYPYLDFDPNRADAYTKILELPTVPLRAYRPDAPEPLDRLLRKALEKQPRDRFKSAALMAAALRPFREVEPQEVAPSDFEQPT
ncbi:MAG TPA: FHA domain-containing serine/threonine-protein kinase [Isosphaeraceae bacterium]